MMKIIKICFLGVMLLAVSCATVKKFPLVQNGKPTSCIVLAENADPIEKHAAAELAMFIKKTSGAEVKIANKEIEGFYPVYLKTDDRLDGVSDQGFAIKSGKNGLYITGKKPIGVLYGVYDFLEKYVGYRWFAPYDGCEFTPRAKTITIAGNMDDRQSPSFEYRVPYPTGGNVFAGQGATNTWNWLVRNKMQIVIWSGGYEMYRPPEMF